MKKIITLLLSVFFVFSCNKKELNIKVDTPAGIQKEILNHCGKYIGSPKIYHPSKHVWLAVGYDLANVAIVNTPAGNVVIDTGMSPLRAKKIKEALLKVLPDVPIVAIIYTHSHIDHVGGASVWYKEGVKIWSTDSLLKNFLKQYDLFRNIETIRGRRQFGEGVPLDVLPCNGIGRRTDIKAALEVGFIPPTNTFSGEKVLDFNGYKIKLIEAHGETTDTLLVWLPEDKTLHTGDDFYRAAPNIYTIRGTTPRPVDQWINSIDKMRSLQPEHLIMGHTIPINGKNKILEILTNYRDAIQWMRDETVKYANMGLDLDSIVKKIKLPDRLLKYHYIKEFYGQLDWNVRAYYTSEIGWFDGTPGALYPPDPDDAAKKEIKLFGGPEKVLSSVKKAFENKDYRWAVYLLEKLKRSGSGDEKTVNKRLIEAYRKLAGTIYNLNGRAYLLVAANELENGLEQPEKPKLNKLFVDKISLENVFKLMSARVKKDKTEDLLECVKYVFPDINRTFYVTIRYGIAEVKEGTPFPNTPEPVATVIIDSKTYLEMATKLITPLSVLKSGKLKIKGSWLKFLGFMNKFEM